MRKQIIRLSLLSTLLLSLLVPISASPAEAQTEIKSDNFCSGANFSLDPETGACTKDESGQKSDPEGTANNLITNVINIVTVIVGIIAVIMIIYGGFRYITSGGNPESVSNAKNTVLYGIIGLVIVALAQFLVRFVLSQTQEVTGG